MSIATADDPSRHLSRSEMPRPLVEGPSAWVGAELAGRPEEWIVPLSATHLAEIRAAGAAARA